MFSWGSVASRVVVFTVLCVIVAALSAPVQAQVLYGTLVGTVEDQTGAVVAAANVTAVNRDTGQSRQVLSSSAGTYSISDLLPGAYDVRITAPGFRTFTQSGVKLAINAVARVNVRLQLGLATETVTVQSSAVALQTDKADVHVELGSKEVGELPLPLYRNYQSLVNLVPGATPARTQNALVSSPGRALSTNINGTARNNNNNRLDGANNIRAALPHQAHYIPPAESIEVVNISTNSFDAEQGFAGGAAVNVVTKSGTNEFHGTLFEYHTNHLLSAKDFFYREERKAKDILNMFGGTLGGPIKRDKLFFFGSFEGLRQRQNQSTLLTVSTDDQRAGDFSRYNVRLYDPLSGAVNGTGRTEFPRGIIPLSRQSAITRKMQDLIPKANQPGVTDNYFASTPVSFNRDNYDAKVNWHISQKTNVWAKYSAMVSDAASAPALGAAGGPGLPWGNVSGPVLGQLVTLAGTHVFSPTLIMDTNVGWTRMAAQTYGNDHGTNFGLDVLGIPGTNGPDLRQSGQPRFSFSRGYTALGQIENWAPKLTFDQTWTVTTNFGWNKGAHDIRFGVDIAREQQNSYEPGGNGPRGGFTFGGGVTALNGGPPPNQFNDYAAFLLGLPTNFGKSIQVFDPATAREWRHGYYFRDRWQATRNLTLSLGLRWEYYPITTRDWMGLNRYDPVTNQVFIGRFGSVPDTAGVSTTRNNWGPRIGIAYRLGQRTVIRTGYGISVDPDLISRAIRLSYPATVRADFNAPNSFQPAGRIEDGIPAFSGPDITSGVIPMPLNVTTTTLDTGTFRRGYVQSFNFVVEREMPWNMVGSVGYVGTRSNRQMGDLDINAAPVGGGSVGRPYARLYGRTVSTSLRKPFLNAKFDSLQAKLDRRFSNGVMMKIAYTWGKAINMTDDSGGGLMWNDLSQFARNRALAGYDRTHMLRLGWLAELPFGAGKKWATGRAGSILLGGWQVNGIFSSYSGTPFTVTASGTSLNAPGNSQTADQVRSEVKKFGGAGPGQPFFDPTAFAPVRDIRYGTSGRNILRGPGVVNLDLSVFRNFAVTERWRVQFRAESFNITNTPHFLNPVANASAENFMIINRTSAQESNLEGHARGFRFGLRVSF
jgi:outer membrane receptor protein involved in Fe transport